MLKSPRYLADQKNSNINKSSDSYIYQGLNVVLNDNDKMKKHIAELEGIVYSDKALKERTIALENALSKTNESLEELRQQSSTKPDKKPSDTLKWIAIAMSTIAIICSVSIVAMISFM